MSDVQASLEALLDDFSPETRRKALLDLMEAAQSGVLSLPPVGDTFNMHCHSFFSFNGYGYSPSRVAWLGRTLGLCGMGLVDFDVLDGVEEFLEACRLLGLHACAGLETRVYVPEFSDRIINSPGEPGISYHMGMGFVPGAITDAPLLASLKDQAQARNRRMVARINELLDAIALDYDADVLPLTPKGNATERHVCAAYYEKARRRFPDEAQRAAYWAERLNMPFEAVEKSLNDAPGFQGVIRAKTMKAGGVGYVAAKGDEFPTADRVNRFTLANGAIPVFAFLDGTTSGEQCMDELLDVMVAGGVAAVNIIPDRNWNFKDAEVRRQKAANLHDFVAKAEARCLPILVGTEMNAFGQPFVDNFAVPEMAPLHPAFSAGMRILHGHTLLQAKAGMGYLSPWAAAHFEQVSAKNRFFEAVGRMVTPVPGSGWESVNTECTPEQVLCSAGIE